ncbi:MAG: hypothetical protein IPO85_18770 [Saprospiraceae bacterium]|uniref:Uncharacterized protein n=1 Tax=Candidatus Defluviibacterium haderslevense TaxID=2981993 RepID=A0A9D7XJ87_9BACT|nr:hypothetical protein [Candidatus Defluviibacterium haderslevense]
MNQENKTYFDELKLRLKNNKTISISVLGMIGVSLLWWPLDIGSKFFQRKRRILM